ncbi:hypothetical protein [Arthrobacter sp. H35-D1]|uniref:hypothetical protein n=1 Tax=Arthrobacter sp. H35-D1 TaxID=3046202 RepID=UPI0024B9862F|nr:hypothetical protein [Arthrobacter sp. H35-D1]MDJ0311747.1 hypothetical protein [Arthrobacter sp. H35-D1]
MNSNNILVMTAVVAMLALTGCSAQANVSADAVGGITSRSGENCSGGFESIWNSTPVDGDVSGLPQETVTVVSETGRIFDAMRRGSDGTAEAVALESVDYKVNVDPSWPKNHAVMIDTATDKVLEIIEIPADAPVCD